MLRFEAHYFDGRTSERRPVTVFGEGASLRIIGAAVELAIPLALIRAEPPVSGQRHLLRLPDGGQLQTEAADAIDALFPREPANRWLRSAETRWWPSIASLAFIAATVSWTIFIGIPSAAEWLAKRMPHAAEQQMGNQTMSMIDRGFCKRSAFDEERKREIADNAFVPLVLGRGEGFRLQMRACPAFGPNALALPDAMILLTDELVDLSGNDEELAAVLAHEVGHVVYRHPVRLVLQASGVAMMLSAVASDAFSITSLAVALPTVLLESGYSRKFEEEADAFALERLRELGIPRARFADILEKLERHHAKLSGEADADQLGDYLSTHPMTRQRIERARNAP